LGRDRIVESIFCRHIVVLDRDVLGVPSDQTDVSDGPQIVVSYPELSVVAAALAVTDELVFSKKILLVIGSRGESAVLADKKLLERK
jgi:hypothetical protein